MNLHIFHHHLALAELLDDDALKLHRHVDCDLLVRLVRLAVNLFDDYLRLRDGELVALAPHIFEQHGDVKLAAAEDLESVGAREINLQADVNLELLLEALANLAGVDELARAAGERRGVHDEVERDGRLVHVNGRKRLGLRSGAERVANVDVRKTGDETDVARLNLRHLLARHTLESEKLGDLALAHFSVYGFHGERLACFYGAFVDTNYGESAHKVVVAEVERLGT